MPPLQYIRTGPSRRDKLAAAVTRAGGVLNEGFQQHAAAQERDERFQQQQANEDRRLNIAQQRADAEKARHADSQRQQVAAAAESAAQVALHSPEAARQLWELRYPDGPGFDETVEPIAVQLKADKQNADLSLSVKDAKAILRSALKQWSDPQRRTDEGNVPVRSERVSRRDIQEQFPAQAFALAQRVGGDDVAAVTRAMQQLYNEAVALDVFLPDQLPSDQEIRRMVSQRMGVAPLAEGLLPSGTQDAGPDGPAAPAAVPSEPAQQTAPTPAVNSGTPVLGALNQALQPQTPAPAGLEDANQRMQPFLEQGLAPAPAGNAQPVTLNVGDGAPPPSPTIIGSEHAPWLEYLQTNFGDNEQFARVIQNAFRSGLDPALIFQKLREKGYFAGSEFDTVGK